MSYTDAESGLIQHIMQIAGRPQIYYPDNDRDVGLPRWHLQVSSNAGQMLTFDGLTSAMTEIVAKVETADGDLAAENYRLVGLLCDAFPAGGYIRTPAGRQLLIAAAPEPRPALVGGGIYARPVIIRARHLF